MMTEQPIMGAGSPYGYGGSPYGASPYGVNPYSVNPYVRNPYSGFGSPGVGVGPGVGTSPRPGGLGSAPW
jgi:hypothetical protein